jgi:uncharacterized protein with PIN domain
MPHALDCTICASRWFSAKYQGRVDFKRERCPDCGGPLVRVDAEPVVKAAVRRFTPRPSKRLA